MAGRRAGIRAPLQSHRSHHRHRYPGDRRVGVSGDGSRMVRRAPMIRPFNATPVRCLIVDDSPNFLDAARNLLECHGIRVVGTASTSAEALVLIDRLRPDVTLVDVNLGDESGFELTERLPLEGRPEP